jgi:hypothetical protein
LSSGSRCDLILIADIARERSTGHETAVGGIAALVAVG